jgi:hypothetical protein
LKYNFRLVMLPRSRFQISLFWRCSPLAHSIN